MNKITLVALVLIVHICSILLGFLISITGERVCRTEDCVSLSKDIRGDMKTIIDPCDDFYLFSCGNYKKYDSMMLQSGKEFNKKFSKFMEEPSKRSDPSFVQKRKQLTTQCLNDNDEKQMVQSLKKVIKLVGGFPTVNADWWQREESHWTFENAIGKFRKAGLLTNMIINIFICSNPFNTSQLILASSNPALVADTCNSNCQTNLYLKMAVLLGANNVSALDDIKDIIQLEKSLRKGILKDPNIVVNESNFMSESEISSNFTFLDWKSYFENLLGRKPDQSKIKEFVLFTNKKYLSFLNFEKIISTNKRLIANYMIWHNVFVGFSYIPGKPRSNSSCERMTSHTGILSPISNYMALQFRDETGYGVVENMIQKLRDVLLMRIDNLQWMDEITRQKAKKKIETMRRVVGYVKSFLDVKRLEEFYKDFTIRDSYIESLLNLNKLSNDVIIFQCYFGSIKDEKCNLCLESSDIMLDGVNAFYHVTMNMMIIPDAILKLPMFDPAWPDYINFGKIGMIVGHELTHSLDTQGSNFDYEGNMREWWQPTTKKKFLEKANCFVDFYNKFQLNMSSKIFQINGIQTLGENIADVGGLSTAFRAYRRTAKDRMLPELKLPYLDYNEEQLFLISFTQLWCHGDYKADEFDYVSTDFHSPDPVRARGGIQNFPFLREVFGCSPGSIMNPIHKCELW